MTSDELTAEHLSTLARYADLFPQDEAECYAYRWWLWAADHLDRKLYEGVKKRRWELASEFEKKAIK